MTRQQRAHAIAKAHGFWDEVKALPPEFWPMLISSKLSLIHSEVSEALEEVREHHFTMEFDEKGKPIGLPSELADAVIRLYDLAEFLGIDLDDVVDTKMDYNETREFRHGNKAL
jgi:NTP pyrophosphatase (non-canonical NTP hydrolase)